MVELVYKFEEKSYLRMFEKVCRSLKVFLFLFYFVHKHNKYNYMDTRTIDNTLQNELETRSLIRSIRVALLLSLPLYHRYASILSQCSSCHSK